MFACTGFTIKLIIHTDLGDTFINANNAVWIRRESKSSALFAILGQRRHNSGVSVPSADSQHYAS